MKESIYAAAVRETAHQRRYRAWMNRGIAEFARWALPVIKTWEDRKPPENRSVMRSLELRG